MLLDIQKFPLYLCLGMICVTSSSKGMAIPAAQFQPITSAVQNQKDDDAPETTDGTETTDENPSTNQGTPQGYPQKPNLFSNMMPSNTTTVESQSDLDMPEIEIVKKMPNDDRALAILTTADQHRNHRLHFTLEQSLIEALRLYASVISEKDVSPDFKARAKIDTAKIYVTMLKHNLNLNMAQHSKEQILSLVNEVLTDPLCSQDMKGWARRFQAKLYLKGFYTTNTKEAAEKAYALLHENLSQPNLAAETRDRSRMQLAQGYLTNIFSVPDKNSVTLAHALYTDVINDRSASSDMRAKARLALATYLEFYQDMNPSDIQKTRFDLFAAALNEPQLTAIMKANLDRLMAKNYLVNAFNVSPTTARDEGQKLLESAAHTQGLPNKQKLFYSIELAEHYLNCLFNVKPSESRTIALKMYNDIPRTISMTPEQSYEYRIALANYHIKNLFHLKPEDAQRNALDLFQDVINDIAYSTKQKSDVRWMLATLFASHALKPVLGDSTTAAVDQFRKIFNDISLSDPERAGYIANLRTLIINNAFGEHTKALSDAMPEIK